MRLDRPINRKRLALPKPRVEVFLLKSGWYYRRIARNGRISGRDHGYSTHSNARAAARKLFTDPILTVGGQA